MAPQEGGAIAEAGADPEIFSNGTGSGGGGDGKELKKGPWTAEEDAVLVEFVGKHGEGNWNNVGKKAGLRRCGKSCRLRWINHLRSNLKKGSFTPQEESKIIRLHAKFGNRWSLLALHLPGRTDNEIKNFWNTRLKKLIRFDLPIYPPEVMREHKHLHLPHHQRSEKHIQNQIRPSSSSSSSTTSSFSSLHKANSDFSLIPSSLPSSHIRNPNFRFIPSSSFSSHTKNPNFNFIPSSSSSSPPQANLEFNSIPSSSSSSPHDHTNHHFNPIPTLSLMNPIISNQLRSILYHPDSMTKFNPHYDKDGGVALFSLPSQNLHLSSSPTPLFDQSQLAQYGTNPMPTMDASFSDAFLYKNFEIEIPSIQSSFQSFTPTSSSANGNDHVVVPPNGVEDNYAERNTYNGLLQDVVGQSRALLSSRLSSKEDKQTKDDQSEFNGEIMHDNAIFIMNVPESNMNLDSIFGSSGNNKTPMEDSSSGFSSIDMGVTSQARMFEDLNIMEDDFLSWIDFQPNGPPQELNQGSDDASTIPVETDHDWEIGSYYWNNIPPSFS